MIKTQVFGKRREPHTVIIAQGQNIRHFTIQPWIAGLVASMFLAVAVGYLLSTGYLILRDDLLNTTVARQAKLQHAYEDRIASLRGQVDRITSHRLLDQQFMENKIAELANRQNVIAKRTGVLDPLMDRAKGLGIVSGTSTSDLPVPKLRPGTANKQARLTPGKSTDPITTASVEPDILVEPAPAISRLIGVRNDLSDLERAQIQQIASLREATLEKHAILVKTAKKAGLPIKGQKLTGIGGPFIPATKNNLSEMFIGEVKSFEQAINALEKTKRNIRSFPIAHPAPGKSISSRFGNRRDPIVRRKAFHAGIDFRTPTGTPIRATAYGKVVKAGRNGGYGKMVEIRHANGLRTRYAHLSKIYVKVGQKVPAGAKIGAAGSTGRSTGPHLHYEVRTSSGKAVNPLGYLNAGAHLKNHL